MVFFFLQPTTAYSSFCLPEGLQYQEVLVDFTVLIQAQAGEVIHMQDCASVQDC